MSMAIGSLGTMNQVSLTKMHQEMFKRLDQNGDGKVDKTEFAAAGKKQDAGKAEELFGRQHQRGRVGRVPDEDGGDQEVGRAPDRASPRARLANRPAHCHVRQRKSRRTGRELDVPLRVGRPRLSFADPLDHAACGSAVAMPEKNRLSREAVSS